MKKYLTIVYAINDPEAFKPVLEKIHEQFKSSLGEPFAITAISADHEVHRLTLIEEATGHLCDLDELRDMIEAIMAHPRIGNIRDIDDLLREKPE